MDAYQSVGWVLGSVATRQSRGSPPKPETSKQRNRSTARIGKIKEVVCKRRVEQRERRQDEGRKQMGNNTTGVANRHTLVYVPHHEYAYVYVCVRDSLKTMVTEIGRTKQTQYCYLKLFEKIIQIKNNSVLFI